MKKTSVIVLTLVAISAIACFVAFNKKTELKPAVARIDFATALVDANKPQFEVYVDGSETAEKQAAWMTKQKQQGYVVQKEGNEFDIVVKPLTDSDIKVALRGPDKRNDNNEFVPVWVDYTSLTIDGEELLKNVTPVWHSKTFEYVINAKNGQEYKVHAKWQEHKDNK